MTIVEDSLNEEPSVTEEEVNQEVEIPEKYQGKSMEDIIAMHENAEKEKSRLGNELGQLRKLSGKLLEMETHKQEPTQEPEELDWDYDTQTAVKQTVNSEVKKVDSKIDQLEQKIALDDFKRKHPTFDKDTGSQEFLDWVSGSKYRTNLYNKNTTGIDFDAAEELMSAWEEVKTSEPSEDVRKTTRKRQLKDASLEKGSSGGTSKKMFNSTELINMKIYEPHKYEAMLSEIEDAYKEGRVK